MIDNLAVFLGCVGALAVACRALVLDAKVPWFLPLGTRRAAGGRIRPGGGR